MQELHRTSLNSKGGSSDEDLGGGGGCKVFAELISEHLLFLLAQVHRTAWANVELLTTMQVCAEWKSVKVLTFFKLWLPFILLGQVTWAITKLNSSVHV